MIAASIAYVGIENLVRGDSPRWRTLIAFSFGLVHGLGFADALREYQLGAELLQAMAHGSAAAWGHLNLLGEYDFSEDKLQDSVGIKPPKLSD
jgi:hypothetical protein